MDDMQKITEQLETVGRQILFTSRNELYMKMRFLDVALCSFSYIMDENIETTGTDGFAIYFNPRHLGGMYRTERILVNRIYLHMVLHCIFRHMTGRKGRDSRYYDLACDIVAEYIIDGMRHRCILRRRSVLRREVYRRLEGKMKVLTAEKVYSALTEREMGGRELMRLEEEFRIDSHSRWPDEDDKKQQQQIQNKWQDISEQMETDMETFSKEASADSGHLIDQVKVENRQRADYRQFLRKFSVLKEEVAVDPDSFDYVFYSYGLELYGNMPLIEPQEWREVQKVEEFVIVIDTSMSCSGELVKKFLEETYAVLSENDSFFRKVNIHIIQCDDTVQTDEKITDEEELRRYMDNLTLYGEGGTDFRPAFTYVDQLLKERAFSRLRGLLYFTDGRGTYPSKMPPYETAFVFFNEDYEDTDVPPWAMKLVLAREDIEGDSK
ncbi:hypothetical protein HMPREF0980_00442 [Dorea sp. D27]|nr:VWA-like domain-containing protein [Dorea sp. D27]KMZ55743.1 hypothetical protein HMPREF0980_00442 [Dorea sp. D27]